MSNKELFDAVAFPFHGADSPHDVTEVEEEPILKLLPTEQQSVDSNDRASWKIVPRWRIDRGKSEKKLEKVRLGLTKAFTTTIT